MKRILYLIVAIMTLSGVSAYAQTDSVRVRLQTNNGAEISLDGDLSSTNIMTKLVAVGKHKVVVNYGSNYSKTYEINIEKGGKTNFEFLIEGKLVLKSTPSDAEVYIDGLPQGKTPLNTDLLGRHNIQVVGNRDIYHPYNTTLEVLPEQVVEHNAILSKRPPKLYGIVVANYLLSANALGFMAGIGRRFGGYIKGNIGINGNPSCSESSMGIYNHSVTPNDYEEKPKYIGIDAGLLVHIIPCLYAYAGSGYGEYTHGVLNSLSRDVFAVKGAELDLGVMFKYKALLLQAGYKRILATGDAGGKFGAFNIGVGITIHKEKKR